MNSTRLRKSSVIEEHPLESFNSGRDLDLKTLSSNESQTARIRNESNLPQIKVVNFNLNQDKEDEKFFSQRNPKSSISG